MYSPAIMLDVVSRAEKMLWSSSEVPVCASVAIGSEVITMSQNMVQELKSPLMHAEFIAIQRASSILDLKYLDQASIYVNLEPCYLCSAVLKKVRIKEIFFGAYSPKTGAIVHGERIFDFPANQTVIIGGIQETRCSKIISEFFQRNIRK